MSLFSITIFCIPFLFFQKKIPKNNFFFLFVFLLFFISNYSYGFLKLNDKKYRYDNDINIKIISPNISLKDYNNQDEISRINDLIKISNPE